MARGGPLSAPQVGAVEALDAVVAATREASPRCGDVVVVALDGPSGAGKTELATRVAARLGCPVVSMDDLYPGWDGLVAGVGVLAGRVLAPLARGERVRQPVWDWANSRWGAEKPLAVTRLVVVEGCGSSVDPAGEYAAVRVWVDAPAPVRKARALARDGATFAPHWHRWAAQERALFTADGTRARADLVVNT